jgi:cytochrome c biogenesis protein CcdA
MTGSLLISLAGLALIDSLNPATIVIVTLILLAAPSRPVLTAVGAVSGAALTVFVIGAALFLSAGAAAGAVDGVLIVLRFLAFGAAGIALIVSGIRRFRDRERKPIALPQWFNPATALPFGIVLTAADLPNAFPYFIAIERMVTEEVGISTGLLVIAGYTLIYCLPCIGLLIVGSISREKTRKWLEKIVSRFGGGTIKKSIPIGLITVLGGMGVISIPFTVF